MNSKKTTKNYYLCILKIIIYLFYSYYFGLGSMFFPISDPTRDEFLGPTISNLLRDKNGSDLVGFDIGLLILF